MNDPKFPVLFSPLPSSLQPSVPEQSDTSALALNLAGPQFDFPAVLYIVLQECEYRRRSFPAAELEKSLMETATTRLAEMEPAFTEAGGLPSYWDALEKEVLYTIMPRYVRRSIEQNRLEESGYDVWRNGDLVARATFAFGALAVGGLILAAPFIPIFEDAFAFTLALVSWFYPDLKRLLDDSKHTKTLNRLIDQGRKYQLSLQNRLSPAALDSAFRSLETLPAETRAELPEGLESADPIETSVGEGPDSDLSK